MSTLLGAIAGGVLGLGQTALNAQIAREQSWADRAANYRYGEMAANNADLRTRNLYNDFYSPSALLRQYREAGLSPSLMFGGTPGQGGMSGAQGNGASGISTPFAPANIVESAMAMAQMENIKAQTEKTKAEAGNIKQDTIVKQLQTNWQEFLNQEKGIEVQMVTTVLQGSDGKVYSMYELAENCNTYEEFVDKIRDYSRESKDFKLETNMATEAGQKTLREIYMATNRFERDIKVLSEEKVSAEFQESLINCLKQKGFAEQNAETAIKQLEAAAEAANLTKEQKSAWNHILERLRKTNSTTADIIIVASMILNQAASHWNGNVWGTKQ